MTLGEGQKRAGAVELAFSKSGHLEGVMFDILSLSADILQIM